MMKKEIWKNQRFMKITASLFLLAVFLCLSFLGSGRGITYETSDHEAGFEESETIESIDPESPIFVDVTGCVKHPGVYQLPGGSRVFQAIELAGGLTEDAEIKSINRAALLSDEQVITVLSKEEYEKQQTANGGIGFVDGKVELNSADTSALESLSGIGPSTAERILEYRASHGRFDSIEEIMNVDGIGKKTFERIKNSICVK